MEISLTKTENKTGQMIRKKLLASGIHLAISSIIFLTVLYALHKLSEQD